MCPLDWPLPQQAELYFDDRVGTSATAAAAGVSAPRVAAEAGAPARQEVDHRP